MERGGRGKRGLDMGRACGDTLDHILAFLYDTIYFSGTCGTLRILSSFRIFWVSGVRIPKRLTFGF